MKKLLFIIGIIVSLQANAQYKYYKDSTYSMPFNLLSSPVSVNNGAWWDDTDLVVNLGFYFRFFKDSVNQVTVSGSGAMVSTTPDPFNKPYFNAIVAQGSDLQDKETSGNGRLSPISDLRTGKEPKLIGKKETN